jgi:soluble lytic murein transglycosylase-like protein
MEQNPGYRVPKNPLAIALLLLSPLAGAHVAIYAYVDEQGVRHYTDMPDSVRYRRIHLELNGLTHSGQPYDPSLLAKANRYDSLIERAAAGAAVEANLLRAVIVVESGFNSRAVSKRGAIGLMQLMPATASRFGVRDIYDPGQNIVGGASYLKFLMDRFGQDVKLALAAYNAGESAVDRSGGQIPPFSETQAYVPRVLKIYRMLGERTRHI